MGQRAQRSRTGTSGTRFRTAVLTGLCLALWTHGTTAQDASRSPEPQGFRVSAVALTGARYVREPGAEPETGTILIRSGRIAAVGPDLVIPPDAETLELNGLLITAGFIDAASTALLDGDVKLPQVERRPVDLSRTALAILPPDDHTDLTPQFLSSTALKLSKNLLDRHRQAGFATVQVVPKGRISSGQSALIQLSGLPPRDAILTAGATSTFKIWERRVMEYPSTMMGIFAHLRQHFLDADRAAMQQSLFETGAPGVTRPEHDPVWQALTAVRQGRTRPLWEVDSRDDIARALSLSDEWNLQPILWGPQELPHDLAALKNSGADVVLTLNFGTPPKPETNDKAAEFPKLTAPEGVHAWRLAQWNERVGLAAQLDAAGIRWAFSTEGLKSPDETLSAIRQLLAHGLTPQSALAGLTTSPAAMFGLNDLGTLAVGQRANLAVLTGPIDHEQTKVRYLFVDGARFEYHRDAKPVATSAGTSTTGTATPSKVDLEGDWTVSIDVGETPFPAQLEIQSVGTGLAGRFTSGQGNGRITRSVARADRIELDISIGAGDAAIVLKFTGKLADNTIKGTLKSPFGPETPFTATRRPAAADSSPNVTLGIEADDDPTAESPVSALAPEKSPKMAPAALPLELPSDRKARKVITGGNVFIQNGTVLTGTGETLTGTSILVKDGKIAALGADLQPEPGVLVIDATGRYIMPGIIDTHSHIMISNGLGGVNEATNSIVCEVRVKDVINTDDSAEYRALAGGVTTIRLFHGSANVIGGQDAIVQLRHGETAAEHLFADSPIGVKFALGENVKFRRSRFPNTRLGVEATVQRAFVEALEYRREWQQFERWLQTSGAPSDSRLPPRRDLRLEALMQILNQETFIHSHCYRSDEILMLLRVAEQHGIRIRSLQHVLEGYKVAPEIVAHGASCSTFADWWAYKVEAADAVPQNATLLHAAGANAVIKSDDRELMRHLNQEAAKSVRYGNADPDVALSFVTLNAARELGIDDRVGSIEVGKQADFAIYNAHPLNTFARCEWTLIAGEPFFVRDQQPTAMSEQGLSASQSPAEISLPAPEERRPQIDWSPVTGTRFALVGGTIFPVDQPAIERGIVLCDGGKIVAVGTDIELPADCPVIDVSGLQVYPGLIDSGTTLGLTEIGKVVETHDYDETGAFQPDLQAGVAINPDSELIPVTRAGGITTAFIRPTTGVIAGQASVMQLAGWTAPEMVRVLNAGLQINWPGYHDNREQFDQLRDWLKAARVYDAARQAPVGEGEPSALVDPRYEALRPYVRGELPLFIEAHSRQHLSEALAFARQEKLRIVLCGASDAWKLASEIQTADVPVIVGPTMRAPMSDFDPFDATYANPGRLHEAGVRFCIRSDNASNSRNAPFEAGMAVAYGLPAEAALRSVTLSAAEILGIAGQTGSITPGKLADLVILDGSPLQVTSQVKGVVIAGQPFRPESRQTRLAEKYQQRLMAP